MESKKQLGVRGEFEPGTLINKLKESHKTLSDKEVVALPSKKRIAILGAL